MIHYSSYPDLYKVMEMFNRMDDLDKKYLFFDNNYHFNNKNFFTKLTVLHYKLIKGQCLMLRNDNGQTIGFVSLDLEQDDRLFITEMYVAPEFRVGSLPILLEMFMQLKMYMRPIYFVVHIDNERMRKIIKFVDAKVSRTISNHIEYVIHI